MAARSTLKRGLRHISKWAFAAADFPWRTRPGPRILIYHQVGSGLGRQMEVTTESFRRHIEWLLENGSIVTLEQALERAGEPDAHKLFVLTFDDGYRDVYETAFPLLASAEAPFLVYVTTAPIEAGMGKDSRGRDMPLTWSQLEEMAGRGATIGAHTHTHPDLRMTTPDVVLAEVEESNSLIESRLGIEPEHFCYPYGYWAKPADGVIRSRYRTATLGGGPPVTAATDPFQIHRVPIQLGDGTIFFRRKMKSGMAYEEKLRRRIAGYEGV